MEPRAACALAVHPVTNSIDRPATIAGVTPSLGRGPFWRAPPLSRRSCHPPGPRPAHCAAPTQSASRPIRTGGWTPVHPLEQAGEPRTRHCGGCGMPRPQLVINAHGWSPDRAATDRQLVRTAVDIDGSDHPLAAEVDPGEVPSVERVGYPHRAGRDGDAGGAAADLDWQAGVAKGAMLDVGWAIAGARRCGLRR